MTTLDAMLHALSALDKPHPYDTPAYKRAFDYVDTHYPRIKAGIAECERHLAEYQCSACGETIKDYPDEGLTVCPDCRRSER